MDRLKKTVLDNAKAFLCWTKFPDLTIQLIEQDQAVGYFVPPSERGTIYLFYEKKLNDFSNALFLLFHEAGHYLQFLRDKEVTPFLAPLSEEQIRHEEEAWDFGRSLLIEFFEAQEISTDRLNQYDLFSKICIGTYRP